MKKIHQLKATPDTVKWGYFDKSWDSVLTVNSGDIVEIEAICHQSGDAPDLMMDEAIKEIYNAFPNRNMGDHIITGPIHVEGAKPGDVLEVKVLDLKPRLDYGSNVLANWGALYDDFDQKEYVIIYRADQLNNVARPEFIYEYPGIIDSPGQVRQPEETNRIPVQTEIHVPLALHFGIAGVTPKEAGKLDSTPPDYFGGNVDNKDFTKNTSMYYKVNNDGGGFFVGDSHFAQGDSELSGTAIEGSINGVIQLILHKDFPIKENPILETEDTWVTHGFAANADDALHNAAIEAVEFLKATYNISGELAYSLLSVSANFKVTQVANGIHGVHCHFYKNMVKQSS